MEIPGDIIRRIGTADVAAFFTGAGMSAESGVPTFRGEDGIWKKMKPEELANFDAFLRNPDLVWEWYKHRKKIMADIVPHEGYHVIARMDNRFKESYVITQNIDNLHRRAGSHTVYELHGNIERNYCVRCGTLFPDAKIFTDDRAPRCERCGGLVRPDVVWFGENLPEDEWTGAVRAAERADVFFSIGTSAVVYPAASIPEIARRNGAFCVEINPDPTPLTPIMHFSIRGKAGEVLTAIEKALSAEV